MCNSIYVNSKNEQNVFLVREVSMVVSAEKPFGGHWRCSIACAGVGLHGCTPVHENHLESGHLLYVHAVPQLWRDRTRKPVTTTTERVTSVFLWTAFRDSLRTKDLLTPESGGDLPRFVQVGEEGRKTRADAQGRSWGSLEPGSQPQPFLLLIHPP